MSVALQFKLTQTGQAAVWNANNTGTSLNLTHIQFGSGNRAPSGTETALLSPQQAVAIAAGFSVSSTQIRMSAIFTGNQNYVVREVGLWAGDPAVGGSKLVGYWSQAAGDLAMKSPGVDFIFSHDMTLDAAVPAGSLTILADNAQSAMLAMIAAHEAKADPHTQYATKAGVQAQTYTAFTTAGVAPTFTLTASPAIAAYAAGQRFRVKFGAAGSGADTLNVNALGAKSLKQYDASGAKVAAVIAANQLVDVEYDGADFILLDPLPSSTGATPAQFDNTQKLATTAFVKRQGMAFAFQVNISAATTFTAANHIGAMILGNQSSAVTHTLPVASTVAAGGCIALQNAGIGVVTVQRQGTDLIYVGAGSNTSITIQPGEFVLLETDGYNWSASGTGVLYLSGSFAGNKIATQGYQKLPNGLIFQWGQGLFSAAPGNVQTPTFAIAFPNACLLAWATNASSTGAGGSAQPPSVGAVVLSTTQVQIQQHTNVAYGTYYNYLAIGY